MQNTVALSQLRGLEQAAPMMTKLEWVLMMALVVETILLMQVLFR